MADESSITFDPREYRENRINQLLPLGDAQWPHKFVVSVSVEEFRRRYNHLGVGEGDTSTMHSVAGRLTRVAVSGVKLSFLDIVDDGFRLQIFANAKNYQSEAEFADDMALIRRGDIVGITGTACKSKRGELSIVPTKITLLSPCYQLLPSVSYGLSSQELRYRKRYLDMIINSDVRNTFEKRSKIITYIRNYFIQRKFMEVETPVLQVIHGGAAAKPFKTFGNDLGIPLYMRVAPELWLKKLIVGGMNRVFEIGKNFRNEGVDMNHNPEFTAVESYEAYADFFDLTKQTEELLSELAMEIHGSYKFKSGDTTLDFTPPFRCISYVEELERCCNVKFIRPLHSEENRELLKKVVLANGLQLPVPPTCSKLFDKLCGHFIESQIKEKPCFITEHPQLMSPLAKWHRSKPELTERGELFVMGNELANFYTELNDPFRQKKAFDDQQLDRNEGDDEANPVDESFLDALEHALPPTGGWGMGIDRLIMVLTGAKSIRDVILFPTMKPQLDDESKAEPKKEESNQ